LTPVDALKLTYSLVAPVVVVGMRAEAGPVNTTAEIAVASNSFFIVYISLY
jgi:hypothetical protein